MKRSMVLFILVSLVFYGCSLVFYTKNCARGPDEAITRLFAALNDTSAISTDLEKPPMDLSDVLDFKRVMRVAPDLRRLLTSFGRGDPQRGWDEFRFLRGLNLFHISPGMEFLEYRMTVQKTELLSWDDSTERYQMELKRVDLLLDMRDDSNFKEAEKYYVRTFIVEFSAGRYCIMSLTPIDDWRGTQESGK